jgi:hypothetical protein
MHFDILSYVSNMFVLTRLDSSLTLLRFPHFSLDSSLFYHLYHSSFSMSINVYNLPAALCLSTKKGLRLSIALLVDAQYLICLSNPMQMGMKDVGWLR